MVRLIEPGHEAAVGAGFRLAHLHVPRHEQAADGSLGSDFGGLPVPIAVQNSGDTVHSKTDVSEVEIGFPVAIDLMLRAEVSLPGVTRQPSTALGDNRYGEVGEIWYDLNIDGVASDLTATFRVVHVPEGLIVRLNDIHVM